MKKVLLTLVFLIVLAHSSFAMYQIVCPAEGVNATNETINSVQYFNNMYGASDCVVTYVADLTPTQLAALVAAQQAQAALPASRFDVNVFLEELAGTNLLADQNVFQYYAVLRDLLTFKNFQGAANLVAGLLQGGAVTQTDVAIIDNTLEEQQINLASYNSEVNETY